MKFNKKLATAALTGLIAAGGLAACATDGDKGHNGCPNKAGESKNGCGEKSSCGAKDSNGCGGANGCNH